MFVMSVVMKLPNTKNISIMKTIEYLEKGGFFKRKEGAKKVYIKGNYNQSVKAYECFNAEDVNEYIYLKKGKEVFTNFDY